MIVQIRKGVVGLKHGVISAGKGKLVSSGLQDKMRDVEESQQSSMDLSGEGFGRSARRAEGTLRKKGADAATNKKLQKFINLKF